LTEGACKSQKEDSTAENRPPSHAFLLHPIFIGQQYKILGTHGPRGRRRLRQAGTISRFSMRKPEARVPAWVAGTLTAKRFAKSKEPSGL